MATMAKDILTTGVGSLPFRDIDEALAYSFKHELPFFPQLLNIHGDMIDQVKNCNFKYLELFINEARKRGKSPLKLQLAGPNTYPGNVSDIYDCIEEVYKITNDTDIYLFFDEPIINHSQELEEVIRYAKKYFTKIGIHCCKKLLNKDVSYINSLSLDIFSLDYILNPNIEGLISKKIDIMAGVITTKTTTKETVSSLSERISYISATCGLAHSQRDPELILNRLDSLRNNL